MIPGVAKIPCTGYCAHPQHALACGECVGHGLSTKSERRKAYGSGAVYFLALTIVDRMDAFTRTELVEEAWWT